MQNHFPNVRTVVLHFYTQGFGISIQPTAVSLLCGSRLTLYIGDKILTIIRNFSMGDWRE